MKIIIFNVIAHLLIQSSLSAWIRAEPVDHAKMMSDSSFSAIVKVMDTRDTGAYKMLYSDGIKYREVNLQLDVLSVFKGEELSTLNLSIFRTPNMEELKIDGVKEDEIHTKYLNLMTNEVIHLYFVSAQKGDQLLIYLKGDPKSGFTPVTGNGKPSRSIFVIEPSSIIRSANLLELNQQLED